MKRRFAVFDIDGTLIRWQLYHAIADALVKLGYIDSVQYQTVKNARMIWKKRTESESFKDYEMTLIKAYDQILTSLTTVKFEEAANMVFNEYKDQVHIYTRDLIKKLKYDGYLLFAISGSQTEIVKKIAGYYDFDEYVGSDYEQKNGVYTGKKAVTVGGKHNLLEDLIKKHNAIKEGSIAVGDSEGDISMLAVVDNPIAFNPSKKLYDHAVRHNWKIVVERKNVVYELEPSDGSYVLA